MDELPESRERGKSLLRILSDDEFTSGGLYLVCLVFDNIQVHEFGRRVSRATPCGADKGKEDFV